MARGELGIVMEAEIAARCGAADQLFNLGMLYAIGRDVPQDFVAAHKWFNLAAMLGQPGSQDAPGRDRAGDVGDTDSRGPTRGARLARGALRPALISIRDC